MAFGRASAKPIEDLIISGVGGKGDPTQLMGSERAELPNISYGDHPPTSTPDLAKSFAIQAPTGMA